MRDCPTIVARGKESKQVPPSVPGDDIPKRNASMHFGLEDQSRS